jgi:dynein light intermediate chain 1, cytosolic
MCADSTRLSVWLVDGDLYHRGLLKFSLTEQSYTHSCVLLVASLARPWDIMDSLARWSDVLATHIQRLKLPPGIQKQQEDVGQCCVYISTSNLRYNLFYLCCMIACVL